MSQFGPLVPLHHLVWNKLFLPLLLKLWHATKVGQRSSMQEIGMDTFRKIAIWLKLRKRWEVGINESLKQGNGL